MLRYPIHKTAALTMVCGVVWLSSSVNAEPPQASIHKAMMPQVHGRLFQDHCLDCHDSSSEEAGVNLEDLSFEVSADVETAERWQKVLNALNSGEMPPEDAEPLEDQEKADFLEALTEQMVVARKILGDSGGQITLRRLNRREYTQTIESLLGVLPDVSSLPTDQTGGGFDTQGASLFFSGDQLEQYLAAAQKALRLCLLHRPTSPHETHRIEPEEQYTAHYRAELEKYLDKGRRVRAWKAQSEKPPSAFGIQDEYQAKKDLQQSIAWTPQLENYLSWPETKTGATLIMTIKSGGYTDIKLPPLSWDDSGRYVIRVRAGHYPQAEPRFHFLEFSSLQDRQRDFLGWRRVVGTLQNPEILEFPVELRAGQRLNLAVHQRTHQDRGDKALWTLHQKQNGIGTRPGVWVDWVELIGPLPDTRPAEAASRILFERPKHWSEEQYVKEVLARFTQSAFRQPTTDTSFLNRLWDHYQTERGKGLGLKEALIQPLAIALSSPEFLYMVESAEEASTAKLNPHELAVRLSYLLWSGPPDDELIHLAEEGKLCDPVVLSDQTTRLLNDSRCENFVRDFTHQWLEMDRLGMFQFNGVQFPQFDNAVRESAREEIYQTVLHALRQNRPLRELLESDQVIINDVLADYYDIPGVIGHEFRPVKVPPHIPRGGLLGTVAVHAMGSDGMRSSPVERGAWIMRHLLNDPPAPAPPNVPQLGRLDGQVLSARELQQAHQEQPQCAQCHRKIDPIGFGLENFAANGRWRDIEIVGGTNKKGAPITEFEIDPSGTLPSGETFDGFAELRSAVANHHEAFARGFAENLISYGLGRPYGFSDQTLLDSMMRSRHEDSHSIRAFVHALVQSPTFQSR